MLTIVVTGHISRECTQPKTNQQRSGNFIISYLFSKYIIESNSFPICVCALLYLILMFLIIGNETVGGFGMISMENLIGLENTRMSHFSSIISYVLGMTTNKRLASDYVPEYRQIDELYEDKIAYGAMFNQRHWLSKLSNSF